MGRIKYKVFFCAFCLDRNPDQVTNDHSFDQNIDVSHLATPHISSNLSLTLGSSSNSTPVGDSSSEDNNLDLRNQAKAKASGSNSCAIEHKNPSETRDRREPFNRDRSNSPLFQPQDSNNNIARPQSSPLASTPSPVNLYELQPAQSPSDQLPNLQNQPQRNNYQLAQNQHQQAIAQESADAHNAGGTATKFSYDIISVREPLAKILAERQQLQQAQLHQRQILGDHEYIEVYGERGSSCFYEEIAGSTTSSATYDQIGISSNHNYQVLINAYAVANHRSSQNHESNPETTNQQPSTSNANLRENLYDITSSFDVVDCPSTTTTEPKPTTSFNRLNNQPETLYQLMPPQPNSSNRVINLSQSIPVYSVINKATRRSNAIIRASVESCRPPQPPPKNLTMNHLPSTSAIQLNHDASILVGTHLSSSSRISPQVPASSSYTDKSNNAVESVENIDLTRSPQPPPRFSKLPTYTATNRPLPLPDNFDSSTLNSCQPNHSSSKDEDLESLNNGYELLTTNFDDDQIDVGYERIRETNRYSGGSLSSQFCPLQALDNGGYESVQPIYSSPSNALAEPNYEAIGPATASELAASATARLTAAAAVLEFLKQDQQ